MQIVPRVAPDNPVMATPFGRNSTRVWAKSLFERLDTPLLFAMVLLAAAGLLAMYSSGYDGGARFIDHARNSCIAFVIMFSVAQIPPQRLMALAVPLYLLGIALLIAVAVFGVTKKGARRWVNVGVTIQPSEILKIAVPLMLAWWFQKREGQLRPLDFGVGGLLVLIPVLLIIRQPDLGTALLVLAAGLSVVFFAGMSWWLVLPPLAGLVFALILMVIFEPTLCAEGFSWPLLHDYQQQRICTLLDPNRDPLGKGFHVLQGMIAIGAGGVSGAGFMQGTQSHLDFIPERTTDFIFAAFAEEFGLLGNVYLLFAYMFLIFRGLDIAMEAPTVFARMLAGSLTAIFFTYAFVNMGMVSGILPVVGVPLPFISYGGTAMVTLGLAMGMLMSVSHARRLVQS